MPNIDKRRSIPDPKWEFSDKITALCSPSHPQKILAGYAEREQRSTAIDGRNKILLVWVSRSLAYRRWILTPDIHDKPYPLCCPEFRIELYPKWQQRKWKHKMFPPMSHRELHISSVLDFMHLQFRLAIRTVEEERHLCNSGPCRSLRS